MGKYILAIERLQQTLVYAPAIRRTGENSHVYLALSTAVRARLEVPRAGKHGLYERTQLVRECIQSCGHSKTFSHSYGSVAASKHTR